MRKLIVCLLATACVGLADAQFRADDAVGVAGQDPATPKAMAVQGITAGKPIPTSMSAPVTVAQPVTVVGETADGATLTENSVPVSGKDSAGKKRTIFTTTSGQPVLGDAVTGADAKANSQLELANGLGVYRPVAMFPYNFNGTNWDRVRGTAANGLWTEIKASIDLPIADLSGNSIGARAILDGTEWSVVGEYSSSQTDTLVKACPAGKRLVITGVFASHEGTCTLHFQDEDDTAVLNKIYQNGSGSGAVAPAPKDAPWAILGTDKDLEVDTVVTGTVNHGFTVKGYIID